MDKKDLNYAEIAMYRLLSVSKVLWPFEYMWKIGHENAFLRTRLDELGVDIFNEIRTKLYGEEKI